MTFTLCLVLGLHLSTPTTARRFRARLRYDGAGFHGVQKNKRTDDGTELRTVLSTLERSLWPALDQHVTFGMAGRTDAGVSATGQVVAFDAECSGGDDGVLLAVNGTATRVSELTDALNSCLPLDLQMTECAVVPTRFDVVRDCRWKRYRYRLPPCEPSEDDEDALRLLKMTRSHAARAARHRAEEAGGDDGGAAAAAAPRRRRRGRSATPLAISDVAAMRRAAALLEGTHDYAAFQASRGDQKGTVRTIFRCAVEQRAAAAADDQSGPPSAEAGVAAADADAYDLVIEGEGFLYKMVRIVAGTLLMVGMGLAPPETVLTALAAEAADGDGDGDVEDEPRGVPKRELRRRAVVGPTLPPERLCLEHVEYEREHGVV